MSDHVDQVDGLLAFYVDSFHRALRTMPRPNGWDVFSLSPEGVLLTPDATLAIDPPSNCTARAQLMEIARQAREALLVTRAVREASGVLALVLLWPGYTVRPATPDGEWLEATGGVLALPEHTFLGMCVPGEAPWIEEAGHGLEVH